MTTLLQSAPTFKHAEDVYAPKPPDPHASEARRLVSEIRSFQHNDTSGARIYDGLVDQLVNNSLAMSKANQSEEPDDWTAPQRCIWRFSKLPPEQRWAVCEDRSILPDVKAYAMVSGARWITRCPLMTASRQPCNGATYASWLDRRSWCPDCANVMVSGRWLEVVWPDNVVEIERVLSERPEDSQRHWLPEESVEDLMRQNEEVHE